MIGLIRGAREVRRLIREASFDSMTSEFSLGVSIAEDLCDADKIGLFQFGLENGDAKAAYVEMLCFKMSGYPGPRSVTQFVFF
jgi:hypothetical protein